MGVEGHADEFFAADDAAGGADGCTGGLFVERGEGGAFDCVADESELERGNHARHERQRQREEPAPFVMVTSWRTSTRARRRGGVGDYSRPKPCVVRPQGAYWEKKAERHDLDPVSKGTDAAIRTG